VVTLRQTFSLFIFIENSVADPDPESGAFLPPGYGIWIRDKFVPDPGSGPFFGEIFLHYLHNLCLLF
jgi:hypothetical protein